MGVEISDAKKLENMGVEAWEAFTKASSDSKLQDEISFRMDNVVLIADAHRQLEGEPVSKDSEEIGYLWAESALLFAKRAIELGRVSPNFRGRRILETSRFLKFLHLARSLKDTQINEWTDVRSEVFRQNPGYHGRRFGPEYSSAVASGRLRLEPYSESYFLTRFGIS